MKSKFSKPLPGVDGKYISNNYLSRPIITLQEKRRLDTYPPFKTHHWENKDLQKLINNFYNQIDEKSKFDYEEIKFSTPPETDIDVYIGCSVNVIRWICNTLSCNISITPTNIPGTKILISTNIGLAEQANSPVITIFLKDSQFKLCDSLKKNDMAWKLTCVSIIDSILKQNEPISPYYILTDYNFWVFLEVFNATDGNINCKILRKKFNDINPSIRECLSGLVLSNFTKRLTCHQEILNIIDANKEICRQKERINPTTYKRLTLNEIFIPREKSALDTNSHSQNQSSILFGSSRRVDDHNTTIFLQSISFERGMADFLHDPIKIRKIESFDKSRLIQLEGTPKNQWMLEKMNYVNGNNNNSHNLVSPSNEDNYHEFKNEVKIYHHLSLLQGNIIPYLHCLAVTDPYDDYDDRRIGLLLEYLPDYKPIKEWVVKMKTKLDMELFSPIFEPPTNKYRYKSSEIYRAPNHNIQPQIINKSNLNDIMRRGKEAVIVATKAIHDAGITHGDLANHMLIKVNDSKTNISVVIYGFRTARITQSEKHRKADWNSIYQLFSEFYKSTLPPAAGLRPDH